MLQCADGSYYVGSTTNLERRITEHETGVNPTAYTYARRPVKLVWFQEFSTKNEAFLFEHQIKGWNRRKKEALIRGDWEAIHQIVRDERKHLAAMKSQKV
jgi:predicted GIY-YIG superfamily endonuclease